MHDWNAGQLVTTGGRYMPARAETLVRQNAMLCIHEN